MIYYEQSTASSSNVQSTLKFLKNTKIKLYSPETDLERVPKTDETGDGSGRRLAPMQFPGERKPSRLSHSKRKLTLAKIISGIHGQCAQMHANRKNSKSLVIFSY